MGVNISAKDVNELRKKTGSGMMDCKKALVEAEGDFQKAIDILRKKGQKVSAARSNRETSEGVVLCKLNSDESQASILSFTCETDFVAKNEDFKSLAQDIMEVAFENNLESIDYNKLVFMHCVSTYPCSLDKINLPRMEKLKQFNNIVGYSGHYAGIDDAIAAICHGATLIEKHFTIDQDLPGRDNKFAILPEQIKALAEFRNNYLQMNLDLGLDLQECEMDTYENYRGRWSKDV